MMRIKNRLLLGFLMLMGIAVFGQTVKIPMSTDIQTRNGKQFYVHTVRKGQTLYSIAKAYHVGLDEIYYANPETRQGIRVGQKIWIPTVNKETEITHQVKNAHFDFFYHVAAAGETIDHIASIYLIPKRYILLANPGIKSPLKEGEYVKIPVESAFPILDGKEKGSSKSYSGGLPSVKPVPGPVTVPEEKTYVPVKKNTSQKKHTPSAKNSIAPGAFNPDIPVIKDYRHVVVAGETLKSIAKKYGITENELKAVNPGLISAFQGERLRLPVTAKVPGYHPSEKELQKALKYEAASGHAPATHPSAASSYSKSAKRSVGQKQNKQSLSYIRHVVKKKETLYSIARQYGVKLEDLYQANPGLTTAIRIGQVIRIPKKKISTDFVYYHTQHKISLKKVAKLYRVDVALLYSNNPSAGRKLFPGQTLRIPVGAKALMLAEEEKKTEEKKMPEEKTEKSVSPVIPLPGKCQPRIHNRTFKVAVMVPLYLEETDSLNMTEFMMMRRKNFFPFRFVEFLEGALIASDSLRNQGMNLQLYVYDVDQTLTKTSKVLTRPELKEMDLIIGPFYSRSFHQVALFANHFGIPIVNPLTFGTGILSRFHQVVKVTPDEHQELSQVARLIARQYANDKVFVISQTAFKDAREVGALCDSIRQVLPDSVYFPNDVLIQTGIAVTERNKKEEREKEIKENPSVVSTLPPLKNVTFQDTLERYFLENHPVDPEELKTAQFDTTAFSNALIYIDYSRDSLHPFEANASVLRNNLVVLYGNQKSFIMDAMNRLNVLTDTFRVQMIGLPEWENIHGLNLHQMDNLDATWPSSYFVDYNGPEYKQYQTVFYQRYATAPGKYGVLGFDIAYYFIQALYHYGNHFLKCLPENPDRRISTRYRFAPVDNNNGNFENTYWNWLRIERKMLIKIPDGFVNEGDTVPAQEK